VASKMGLRAVNYGCGASIIALLVPFIIMNAQLIFTVFPILLKMLPIPKDLVDILKFSFGDAFDMFDMLIIIVIDVLILLAVMLIFGIIYWVVNAITKPFEFLWALMKE